MAHFPHSHSSVRAPRVRVPDDEAVCLALDGRKIAGTLHRISITGGLVHLPNKLNAGTLAEVILDTTAGRVTGLVELLGPTGAAASGFHAFRFVALNDTDHDRLNGVIKHMLSLGHKA